MFPKNSFIYNPSLKDFEVHDCENIETYLRLIIKEGWYHFVKQKNKDKVSPMEFDLVIIRIDTVFDH